MGRTPHTALIAGENDAAVRAIQRQLHSLGYIASWTKSAYSVLERVRQDPPDVILMAQDFLAEGGGWILCEQVWEISAGVPVVIHMDSPVALLRDIPLLEGPHATLRDPLDSRALADAIAMAKGENAMK